ncbi:hypothetical protein BH11MYX1_BH11MYX1_28680 [soil metagenome]
MRRSLLYLFLLLGGCSRLFGLVTVEADDRDGDRIPDQLDNCPDKPNPDQSNIDGDDVGDACQGCQSPSGLDDDHDGIPNECDGCDNRGEDLNHDSVPDACETLNDAGMIVINPIDATTCVMCQACPLGPAHDEDGDTIADACDPCPPFPPSVSPTDADPDLDGIADRCDTSTGQPSHQLFDPFTTPNQIWVEDGGTWTVTHDELRINPGLAVFTRSLGVGVGDFTVRTEVALTGNGLLGSSAAGVRLAHTTDGVIDLFWTCEVTSDGLGAVQVQIGQKKLAPEVLDTIPVAPTYSISLEYRQGNIVCLANGQGGKLINSSANLDPWVAGLTASGPYQIAFKWYQFVTDN